MKRNLYAAGVGAGLVIVPWACSAYKTQVGVTFNSFDLLTTVLAVISIAFNFIQWHESRTLLIPVRNPLIGLFNELKSRQQRVWGRQARITESSTPMELFDFTEEMLQAFEQLREHVISLIETVSPGLKDDEFYRASTRGLDNAEREMRAIWVERRRREEKKQAVVPEPTKVLFRHYEGNLEAVIVRGFESGFEWFVEDKTNKVVIEDGKTEALDVAKLACDRAAGRAPTKDWRSR